MPGLVAIAARAVLRRTLLPSVGMALSAIDAVGYCLGEALPREMAHFLALGAFLAESRTLAVCMTGAATDALFDVRLVTTASQVIVVAAFFAFFARSRATHAVVSRVALRALIFRRATLGSVVFSRLKACEVLLGVAGFPAFFPDEDELVGGEDLVVGDFRERRDELAELVENLVVIEVLQELFLDDLLRRAFRRFFRYHLKIYRVIKSNKMKGL